MFYDLVVYALRGIRTRKLRSWLTIIGIIIGITAVVSLVSLGQGLQNVINTEFEKIGSDRITVMPAGAAGPMGGGLSAEELSDKDLRAVRRVKGVGAAMGILSQLVKLEYKGQVKYVSFFGVPTETEYIREIEKVGFFEIETGREFKPGDRYKVVLGNQVAYDMFDKDIGTQDKVLINGIPFDVIGVQKLAGTGIHDVLIRIPLDVAREITYEPDKISTMFVRADKGYDVNDVAERIEKDLRQLRNEDVGEESFSVETAQQTIAAFNSILDVVQVFIVGIAGIALLVGGIGIMNTMYTAVFERRKEIGIMKAVGAKNMSIIIIFLVEAGLLGMIGGVIGVIFGLGISKIAEIVAIQYGINALQAYTGINLIAGALAFSFLIGAASGVFPARQAARLNVVEALKKA